MILGLIECGFELFFLVVWFVVDGLMIKTVYFGGWMCLWLVELVLKSLEKLKKKFFFFHFYFPTSFFYTETLRALKNLSFIFRS